MTSTSPPERTANANGFRTGVVMTLAAVGFCNAMALARYAAALPKPFALYVGLLVLLYVVSRRLLPAKPRRIAFAGGFVLAFLVPMAHLILTGLPHYRADQQLRLTTAVLAAAVPPLRQYIAEHHACPDSPEQLGARRMPDYLSKGKNLLFAEVDGFCAIRSVGFDGVDDAMARSVGFEHSVYSARYPPLRDVLFGEWFADDDAIAGDIWIGCSRDGRCRSSFPGRDGL